VDLGDCTIGSSRKGDVVVRNNSELACSVALRWSSKILKVARRFPTPGVHSVYLCERQNVHSPATVTEIWSARVSHR
jgi:hypothetical protein